MALAGFGDPHDPNPDVAWVVDEFMRMDDFYPFPKEYFRKSPVFNCGIPSALAGGCGLNCEWNAAWRKLGHFSSVFVSPCPNDSGSAIGTAIDAHVATTGSPHIDWDVYSGLEFERDTEPDPVLWHRRPLDIDRVAKALADGQVVPWVQGRSEIGPRALGNRSLLAEPFRRETRDRLNEIKQREAYRPIAPCARVEDLARVFDEDFRDPHMLYFEPELQRPWLHQQDVPSARLLRAAKCGQHCGRECMVFPTLSLPAPK